MVNMVNKLNHEVEDVVTLADGSNGVIVDIVDGGNYRVKTDTGIVTVGDEEIKEKLTESIYDEDYISVTGKEIGSVSEMCDYLIPGKSYFTSGTPISRKFFFNHFEGKNPGDSKPYYACFNDGNTTLSHLFDLLKMNSYKIYVPKKDYDEIAGNEKPDDDGDNWDEQLEEGKLMQYAKDFFNKMKNKEGKTLEEGLHTGDMEYMISPYVSIDEYTSKVDQDDITIALFCGEKAVCDDLRDFIEKMYYLEIRDIEVSDSLTEDNKYIIFIELKRDEQFPKILVDILDSICFLIKKQVKDWKFITLNMNQKQLVSVENIKKYVRLQPIGVDIKVKDIKEEPKEEKKEESEVKKESVEYSKDGITRRYIDEGYITEDEMNKIIEESETLDENTLDMEVLEYNLPESQIFTTDNNVFVVTGDKIKKLGF